MTQASGGCHRSSPLKEPKLTAGVPIPMIQRKKAVAAGESRMPSDLAAFLRSEGFPCVGAKSALSLGQLRVLEAGALDSPASDPEIHDAIVRFGASVRKTGSAVASLIVMFEAAPEMDEVTFERALWRRLQALHDLDVSRGFPWASDVSNDPDASNFSLSLGGQAYFVVGMHPGASRAARRFSRPALAFNAHGQFERLRADGRYGAMQRIIRQRELAAEGSINPMLNDFNKGREAAQYSGRRVSDDWTCPFRARSQP